MCSFGKNNRKKYRQDDTEDKRTPLIKDGRMVVQINECKSIRADNCGLTTLEGFPKKLELSGLWTLDNNKLPSIMIEWYNDNRGYSDFWIDLLKHTIQNHSDRLSTINWPEGFLNDNLKKSAKGLGKYSL